jgi:TolA-binding protein
MKTRIVAMIAALMLLFGLGQVSAAVYDSEHVLSSQQHNFQKQQVLAFVDTAEVQQKLMELGVSPEDAKQRIANMTTEELDALNTQLNDMPAGGIIGIIVAVLVVLVVLDLAGVTDVFSFIRPI